VCVCVDPDGGPGQGGGAVLPEGAAAGIGESALTGRRRVRSGRCTLPEGAGACGVGLRALADGRPVSGVGLCAVAERGGIRLARAGTSLGVSADRRRTAVGGGAAGIRKGAHRCRELPARERGRAHDGGTHVGCVRALAEGAGVVEIGVRVLAESRGIRAVRRRGLPTAVELAPLAVAA